MSPARDSSVCPAGRVSSDIFCISDKSFAPSWCSMNASVPDGLMKSQVEAIFCQQAIFRLLVAGEQCEHDTGGKHADHDDRRSGDSVVPATASRRNARAARASTTR